MFLVRVLWFFVRLALYQFQGVLRFIGKPGSRAIVPALMVGAALLGRALWHDAITAQLRLADPGYQPEPQVLDVVLFVSVAALSLAYVIVSKVFAFILGAVPMTMRPLWPQRGLRVPKEKAKGISAAVVRLAVPPLPRQRP